jgi:hypothetical protein
MRRCVVCCLCANVASRQASTCYCAVKTDIRSACSKTIYLVYTTASRTGSGHHPAPQSIMLKPKVDQSASFAVSKMSNFHSTKQYHGVLLSTHTKLNVCMILGSHHPVVVVMYCGCFNLFRNVWVCVCVGFVMCGCVYVWVL